MELEEIKTEVGKKFIILNRPMHNGRQVVFKFPNGFGASLIQGPYTYGGPEGLFELAVVEFDNPGKDDFNLTYDTEITDDVLGYLTEKDVIDTLTKIKGFQRKQKGGIASIC